MGNSNNLRKILVSVLLMAGVYSTNVAANSYVEQLSSDEIIQVLNDLKASGVDFNIIISTQDGEKLEYRGIDPAIFQKMTDKKMGTPGAFGSK
ncbi:MAG: hypothetical protein A2504_12100 [Bdellovibrionales bacterium RIFOXYD12_FULL_39_22]|nr:MAG: hypothetical protein A2385_01820 [Bdellovibrionales bacterium RIFOXYB1_FULL_39_21]OFZ46436.1 MAG: hypothetical protein A2404_09055 [Bdellovibrionales bacterium RIFOXYC1_FULL_39_130]OFZ72471.1 MAG: hypothetical protein A2451_08980 [Bdellovibrionales bacterium RIFOXYC2_FULL_39_8]OFZ75042.1 MAG: hypothetical protein A2560_10670 [Bdellovibrionales bacterium RIFOXYD1_FULL_39_84]OFZ94861.1 MAG: hypothetical protein A2504_12100 [Bdellovibrionales bacterium RIFOXYD12_FULL_39_22]HLE12154.1 hypo